MGNKWVQCTHWTITGVSNGKQMSTMHSVDSNWRSKGHQTMKFGQIIDDKVRNIFHQRACWKWRGEMVQDLFLFHEIKASGQHLSSNTVWYLSTGAFNKNCILNFILLTQGNTQLWFFRKRPWNSFSTTFWVSVDVSLMLYSINWTKFNSIVVLTSWDFL